MANKLNSCVFKLSDIDDKYFLENLENRELLCRCGNDFNDLYEFHHVLEDVWPNYEKNKDEARRLIDIIDPSISSNILSSKESYYNYISDKHGHLVHYTQERITENSNHFRICSFTRRWNNQLMWAHYANGGRGVGLVFDSKKIWHSDGARTSQAHTEVSGTAYRLSWVRYSHNPPRLNAVSILENVRIGTEEKIEEITKRMLDAGVLTKCREYRYEQESRLIIRTEGQDVGAEPILYKYNPEALQGMIIGPKSNLDTVRKAAAHLPSEAHIYFTKPSKNRYKLEIAESMTVENFLS